MKYKKEKRQRKYSQTVQCVQYYNEKKLVDYVQKVKQLSDRIVSTYSSVQCIVRLARKCMEESCAEFVVKGFIVFVI